MIIALELNPVEMVAPLSMFIPWLAAIQPSPGRFISTFPVVDWIEALIPKRDPAAERRNKAVMIGNRGNDFDAMEPFIFASTLKAE
jgi:hypothetical protein